MSIIEASSYQPFCSTYLGYSSSTATVTSTSTYNDVSTTTTTTTSLVAQTKQYRKRDVEQPSGTCDCENHDHQPRATSEIASTTILRRRSGSYTEMPTTQLQRRATSTSSAVSNTTPTPLRTFSSTDLSSACSSEVTSPAVSTSTIMRTVTASSTSTVTKTATSTTVISVASSAPTGVVGYMSFRNPVNTGGQFALSDPATHMTDNYYANSTRETFIVTNTSQLYSVTNNAYYYYQTPAGNDKLYWSTNNATGTTNWLQNATTSDGYTQLLMVDTRYTTRTYYKFCLKTVASGDGNSATGLHVYYFNQTATFPTNCVGTQLWFAPS